MLLSLATQISGSQTTTTMPVNSASMKRTVQLESFRHQDSLLPTIPPLKQETKPKTSTTFFPLSTARTTTVEDGVLQLDSATGQLSWLDLAGAINDVAWNLEGNSGTSPGVHFLGTKDAQPLELHVDHDGSTGTDGRGRAMRFEPNSVMS